MRLPLVIVALAALLPALPHAACAAASEADARAALAAAEAAENDAGALKNRWTTTEQALSAARKAAAAGDFAAAVEQAHQAEALAKASIAQAKEQESAWRAAIIR